MTIKNEIPRRVKMQEWCESEKAIHNAMQEVEKMTADVRLTRAVVLLGKAQDAVADFVDNLQGNDEVMYPEEFIRWISVTIASGKLALSLPVLYWYKGKELTLPELLQYWKDNINQ